MSGGWRRESDSALPPTRHRHRRVQWILSRGFRVRGSHGWGFGEDLWGGLGQRIRRLNRPVLGRCNTLRYCTLRKLRKTERAEAPKGCSAESVPRAFGWCITLR